MKAMKRTKAMKATGKAMRRRSQGVVLPDDACPDCGTRMKERSGKLTLPVNGEVVSVSDVPHLRCPKCHETVLRMDDARKLQHGALENYRKKYGLLTGVEIRTVRERFGLTQAELARLLRLGSNTISRWEADRNVQAASMDILLRMIRDLPGSLEYLRKHAA